MYISSIKELQEYSPYLNSQNGNFELRLVRELYHIDDSLIGYYVNIYEGNKLIGFALLSAKSDLGNLLEWGPLENEEDTHYGQILLEKPEQKAYYLSLNNIVFANNLQHLYNKLEKQK